MITMIAAAAENNALGKNNDLLWHLPDDFKRFKQITSGHHIIMGRKTFESFPKPLPNRTSVIITRQKYKAPEGCLVAKNLQEALSLCPKNQEIFIIGGGEIYKLALPFANKIELTRVHESFDADAFFPEFNLQEWQLQESVYHPADEKHQYAFTYETYIRK
ncbi:dihydrofolate reductase [Flavobacterium sp. NST-5]|uniref:Dihydrofolate reductase n=1 Tax=Flavobacterium ichthyis TaxID=2698827 RepID=A0ABW9Z7Q3_9FLAO|nr:dihydrofolate reductase [Flavobacterium ichthyis]NBL63874.1 dihydrofolate reductase [Flavobacterium ichthyis]